MISEDSYFVAGHAKRQRGRPRKEDPGSPISTRVPTSYHDLIVKLAHKHDTSVSSMVRSLLMIQLNKR